MGALFGGLSALSIGLSDLFARRVVHSASAITAGVAMQLVAVFASLASIAFLPSAFSADDLITGAVSGIGMATGLACYLTGLDRSSSTVVAPIVGVMSAVIPFGYTLGTGSRPSAVALGGALVAFVGLALISAGRNGGSGRPVDVGLGVRWALASGLGYGFGLTVIIEVSEASGAWPAVSQRMAAFAVLVVVAYVGNHAPIPPMGLRAPGIVAGVFAALSTITYLIGVQADASPAVVTASMFPAASVLFGRWFYSDPVSQRQIVGLAIALAGVAGVVAG